MPSRQGFSQLSHASSLCCLPELRYCVLQTWPLMCFWVLPQRFMVLARILKLQGREGGQIQTPSTTATLPPSPFPV